MRIVIRKLISITKFLLFKKEWRAKNIHNFTTADVLFPIDKVNVGRKTYGPIRIKNYGNPDERLVIGSFCSIATGVLFLLGGEHPYTNLSTYPFHHYICGVNENTVTKGPIIVHDDVWIGQGCLILSGVTIGQGAVIGAGSVVSKDIPPYAVYAGGRIIKYRFSTETINKLLTIDFDKLTDDIIKNNIDYFYNGITDNLLNTDFFKSISR